MFKNRNVVVLLLILTTHNNFANAAAGDNEHLFLDICNLLELGKRAVSQLSTTNLGELAYNEIQKLNMSLSSQAWKKRFTPKKGSQAPSNGGEVAPVSQEKAHERDVDWKKAAAALAGDEGDKATLKLAGMEGASNLDNLQYLSTLQPLAERAAAIIEQLKTLHTGSASLTDTKIKEEIQTALYGKGAKTAEQTTLELLKGVGNSGTDRKDICGKDGTAAKADTVMAYLFCLCAPHSGDSAGAEKVCTETQTTYNKANTDVTTAHTEAQQLANQCHGTDRTQPLKETEIDTVVVEFTSKLKAKNQKPYFGKYSATRCDGSSTNGICVMFKTTAKGEGKAVKQIPWVLTLHNAAEMIRQQVATNAKIDNLNQELQAIQTASYALKPQLEMYKQLQETTEKASTGQQLTEMQAGDCNNHKSNSTCPKNNCKWEPNASDKSKGTCKPKDGERQTNTAVGAGERDAGDTDKCGDAKNPEECAAVKFGMPKGKKAACKWI
uniref:Variant surface glycoprotein 1125.4226 n=1 Tax=Trypanosoma brucei TaxID=5691 RepID=A0A1J0RA59_9TRYP|nr:variant surface glycoprotein 1125.4226 [Trypanosoma brucei]